MDPLLQNIIVLLMASFPIYTYAYPNGQVTAACDSMTPSHGASSQTSSPPYTLSLDKYTYSPGDKIKVILSGSASQFRGFMIQARSGSSTAPLGSFVTSNADAQVLTCTSAASAVSQTSSSGKSSIDVTWVAPASVTSDIQIKATVVQTGQVFWTNVASAKIAYVSNITTPSTTVGNPSSTNTTVNISTDSTTTTNTSTTSSTTATSSTTTTSSTTATSPTTLVGKSTVHNIGVQYTWTLEVLLISCGLLIASYLG
ncbi:putative defense protein isoform X1 [Ranitomeya imitator]